jgi:ribosomal protein S18 acetylase RimI-like enzyme
MKPPPEATSGQLDTLEIRPFLAGDLDDVIGLWRSCNLTRPWNDPGKDIARKLRVNRDWFLVAVLDREIVGSIMVGYEVHRGWINYLAVAPSFRCLATHFR